jgi:hypothetical protein
MEVLITPEAGLEIEALRALHPAPSTWGAVIGHQRGPVFVVERIFPAGSRPGVPDERALAGLDRIWPGRILGLLAVRPDAALRKAFLGPAWYGKLVLVLTGPVRAPALRPFAVEFDRKFFLQPVPFAPGSEEAAHE